MPQTEYKDIDFDKFKDRKYKGDDYEVDTSLRGGTKKTRRCTDLACALLFVFTCLAMFFSTIYSYIYGEPAKYMAPIDRDGNMCGFTNETKGYDYLYIADIKSASASPTKMFAYSVCVEECPNGKALNTTCSPESQSYCNSYVTYGSWDLLGYCIPIYDQLSPSQQIEYDNLKAGFQDSTIGSFVLELYMAKWVMLICIAVSMLLSVGYIKLMDWAAYYMAWVSVIMVWVALILVGVCAYVGKNDALVDSYLYGGGEVSRESVRWYKVTYYTCWIFASLYCLCAMCKFHSLRVSIKIVEVASDFYGQTKRMIFIPLMYFLIGVIIFVMWLFALACVCSLGEIEASSVLLQSKTVDRTEGAKWMIAFMVIGMIWIVEFLAAANQFVIICAAADWYFDPVGEKHADVYIGMGWSMWYQMGTLAFGSLLLMFVDVIRGIFEYIGDKLSDAGANNGCTKCLLNCTRCCLDCFDRCLRFINMNAYIYCAIAGTPFCESAVHAFLLMLKNSAKFGFVNSIGAMFMFLAKAAVAAATTGIGFGLLQLMVPSNSHIWLCLLLIFIMAYFVASTFISVFDAAANTILQCFILDQEIATATGDPTTYVPEKLQKFLDDVNKKGKSVDSSKAEQNQANLID